MRKILAVSILIFPLVGIFLICAAFLLSPADRPAQQWFMTGPVSEIPDSGDPISMVVYKQSWDSWTRYSDVPVCSVFVRKDTATNQHVALPGWHAGSLRVPLVYDKIAMKYVSACWCEEFDLNGKKIPVRDCENSEEALPRLAALNKDGRIWVQLQDDIY